MVGDERMCQMNIFRCETRLEGVCELNGLYATWEGYSHIHFHQFLQKEFRQLESPQGQIAYSFILCDDSHLLGE